MKPTREREDGGSDEVHRDAPEHAPPLEGKAPGQPEDGERGERPEVRLEQALPQNERQGTGCPRSSDCM